jgi:prepilin peptidase CpaA
MSFVQLLLLTAFPALVIVAGLRDAVSFTIPNWISIALALAYFPAALAVGVPLPDIGTSLALGFGALVIGMGMFAMNWIGGGDAKLLAAATIWIGLPALAPFLLITGVAGGALALFLLQARSGLLRPLMQQGPAWVGRLATPGGDVPYGVAIAVGALASFPQSLLVGAFTGAV